MNLTVHSYDGRMNIGLVVDPAAMPDPHRFIERIAYELDLLAGRCAVERGGDRRRLTQGVSSAHGGEAADASGASTMREPDAEGRPAEQVAM